jgi:hypothetical protein
MNERFTQKIKLKKVKIQTVEPIANARVKTFKV